MTRRTWGWKHRLPSRRRRPSPQQLQRPLQLRQQRQPSKSCHRSRRQARVSAATSRECSQASLPSTYSTPDLRSDTSLSCRTHSECSTCWSPSAINWSFVASKRCPCNPAPASLKSRSMTTTRSYSSTPTASSASTRSAIQVGRRTRLGSTYSIRSRM